MSRGSPDEKMLLLLFAVAAATFVYYYMCNRKLYGDLPGPSPLLSAPFVGHAYLLGADPAKKLMEYRYIKRSLENKSMFLKLLSGFFCCFLVLKFFVS